MNEMMCPLPFMVSVEDPWEDKNEIYTVYAEKNGQFTQSIKNRSFPQQAHFKVSSKAKPSGRCSTAI